MNKKTRPRSSGTRQRKTGMKSKGLTKIKRRNSAGQEDDLRQLKERLAEKEDVEKELLACRQTERRYGAPCGTVFCVRCCLSRVCVTF